MTDCPNGAMRDLLPDLLHGGLTGADRASVEAHLGTCADCRSELALLRSAHAMLRRAPSAHVAAIVSAVPAYRAPAPRQWSGWRAAAAIAAIAIGGTSVAVLRHGPPARIASTPSAQSVARVASAPPSRPVDATPSIPAPVEVAEAPRTRVPPGAAQRELAVSGSVSDLSDGELASLLSDIGSLDVLPSRDVDVTPLVPSTTGTPPGEAR
jgi:anti-sigma factor RsiW